MSFLYVRMEWKELLSSWENVSDGLYLRILVPGLVAMVMSIAAVEMARLKGT